MTTAGELVKKSYYMAKVLDPREEIEGFQASEGMFELNRIIDTWGSLMPYIPSYTILTVPVIANDYSYDVTPVITELSEAHLLDSNNVQFNLYQIDLHRFNTLNFALSAQSPTRPDRVFIQNDFADYPTKSKVIFYPVPDQSYTATLYAMQRLANLTYSQDITTVPSYYVTALEFKLARRLMVIYSTNPAPAFESEYQEVMRQFKAANRRDKSSQGYNIFRQRRNFRPWGTYVG